ncbi:rhodopsin-like [Strongylocentrotus purpuratus]|uniref:G-protein coupled receptors family 1 profile domain-containing protein n=1 Tax=Strongylocentrotus purpuratus TaxID=7668 RepID=A0A7M7NAE9_STRPU|nr:rhodopsin-like [Strongylocentrotus purpuratus]
MNTTLFIADYGDVSDFAFENVSTLSPGGYDSFFPGYHVLIALNLWYKRIQISVSTVAAVFSFVVLVVIGIEKSFHNVTNYFVANLMMSDFVFAVSYMVEGLSFDSFSMCGGLIMYLQHIPSYFLLCVPDTSIALVNHIYIYTIMFLIPGSILIFCYSRIAWRVLRSSFRKKHLSVARKQDVSGGLRAALQTKLTRMVVLILLVFFLFRAPRSTFVLYKYMTGWASAKFVRDRIVLFTFILLNQSNCAVDPFIYAFCAPQFREYLLKKLCSGCHQRKQDEPQTLSTVLSQAT